MELGGAWPMNVANIRVSMQVTLADGSLAEVLAVKPAELQVRVKYLDPLGSSELTGTEATVSADEVIAIVEGTHTEGPA